MRNWGSERLSNIQYTEEPGFKCKIGSKPCFFSLHNNWWHTAPYLFSGISFKALSFIKSYFPKSHGWKSLLGQTLVNLMTLGRKSLWTNEEMSFLLTIQTSGFGQAVILPWPIQSRARCSYFLKSYNKYLCSGATLIGVSIQKQADSTVADYKSHIL